MAKVYRAEHVLLKQDRALKIISPLLLEKNGFIEAFIKESQIIASLDHPNIVKIHTVSCYNNIYFMDMEYLKGGNLAEKLEESQLSLQQSLKIISEVGKALHYAHKKGIIHRDIKPENIMFTENNKAVLTDFGISKTQGTNSHFTQHGYKIIGTPRYMSPEQKNGEIVDQRSDIYSLALIFYEMLTGEKLIQEKINIPTPLELPSHYLYLQSSLSTALKKNPKNRYTTVQNFITSIFEEVQDNDSIKNQKKIIPNKRLFFQSISILSTILLSISIYLIIKEHKLIPLYKLEEVVNNTSSFKESEENMPILKMKVRVSPYTILYTEPNFRRSSELGKGTIVNVLNEIDKQGVKWIRVRHKGEEGYIKASHLK